MAEPSKLPIADKEAQREGRWKRMNAHHRPSPETRKKAKLLSERQAADRAKHGVNTGLNTREVAALSKLEGKNRTRKTEQLNIVDDNGNVVFSKNGSVNRVRFSYFEGAQFKDRVLTHNHPYSSDMGKGLHAEIGIPLSGADIRSAMKFDAKEVRASAQGYVFSIKRPKGGWKGEPETVGRELERAMDSHRWASGYVNKNGLTYEQKLQRQGRFNVAQRDQELKKLAKKYGFTYTRTRLS